MKIFKNRGDVYISKSGYKSSKEERILLIILAIIVAFTVVFVALLAKNYSSPAEFFGEGAVTTTENIVDVNDESLPDIEGKTNYLVMETDDNNSTLHFIFLVEADADSLAYKVTALSPDMIVNKKSISDVYLTGGGAAVQTRLTEYFGFQIDYYAQFKDSEFVEFINKMGSFIYPIANDIRYDGGGEEDAYTLRLREGENKIDGKKLSNLLRYYSVDKPNFEGANQLILYALTGLFNADNYDSADRLFRTFITNASSNITVRDFENGKDALYVFCKKNKDITIYSVKAEYENKTLTNDSMHNIKGYFNK